MIVMPSVSEQKVIKKEILGIGFLVGIGLG
ncbi:Uncharacterised protein [Neisseria lactamica]|uniref:Uncharacterized protein n=1 Tax=Neisseria lactamica TaxID=486 RepID=A0A378VF98_NEILA|nr:hypothetical protein DR91_1854 [Neisseria lactamica ATCC 23970]CWP58529.1 Uncharacterised protein [Neisseria meningitidis]SUA14801.1 Uncharacterised protein [Neisseria lactamica]CWP63317.1 Uncharacterised protein [Neisseria meningitidis]CWT42599.1 Uncharacterised protein [Neisseria meningitidis]